MGIQTFFSKEPSAFIVRVNNIPCLSSKVNTYFKKIKINLLLPEDLLADLLLQAQVLFSRDLKPLAKSV
jgi:hypothetical protein